MPVDIAPGYVKRHARIDVPHGMSIPKFVQLRAATDPDGTIVERKTELGDVWLAIGAREYVDQMRALAAGFLAEGVRPGDGVALFAPTSYEWTLADLALQAIGARVIPIYESDSPKQIQWIMSDSGATRVITQTPAQAAVVDSVSDVSASYVIDEGDLERLSATGVGAELPGNADQGQPADTFTRASLHAARAFSRAGNAVRAARAAASAATEALGAHVGLGGHEHQQDQAARDAGQSPADQHAAETAPAEAQQQPPASSPSSPSSSLPGDPVTAGAPTDLLSQVDRLIDAVDPDTVATIVYTSGTTGRPRGVPLTHRNLVTTVLEDLQFFPDATLHKDVRMLLFLPQAHIYARTACYMALLGHGVCGHVPNTRNLVNDFQSFHPTTIGAVPRVLEKIYAAVKAQANTRTKKMAFNWCQKVAEQRAAYIRADQEEPAWLQARYKVAQGLIFKKLEAMLGGNMRCVCSGGAPLSEQVELFFTGMGIRIYNGYGMTESSGGIVCNTTERSRLGSVGTPVGGTEIKIAEDGEILIKGPGVFTGYHNEEQFPPALFTPDGWYRTGDLGTIDEDGFLFISGRKKEIIVTAGGKNVQPARVEDKVCGHPLVSHTVAVGEGQKFIGALITLDADALPTWLDNHGLPGMDVASAAKHPAVRKAIARAITRANKEVSRAESIRKFTIIPRAFTEANGLLTPSLKVKRGRVYERYAAEIAALYQDTSAASGTNVPQD